MVSPAKFLNLAAECGRLHTIDRLMFKKVCEDIDDWDQEKFDPGQVSINLSGPRLMDPSLLRELEHAPCDLRKVSI